MLLFWSDSIMTISANEVKCRKTNNFTRKAEVSLFVSKKTVSATNFMNVMFRNDKREELMMPCTFSQ